MMDVGAWTLIAFQSSFFERVHNITPDVYAPLLAVAIPVGGASGGILTSFVVRPNPPVCPCRAQPHPRDIPNGAFQNLSQSRSPPNPPISD